MKNLKIQIFILFFVSLLFKTYGQDYYDTICWVWVNNPQYYAVAGDRFSDKNDLNALLIQNEVQYYEQAYPFAKTSELLKIHEIRCANNKNINDVILSISSRFGDVFYNFSRIEIIDNYPMDYDPIDWMWVDQSSNVLWHLKKIQANLAWDITQGDTLVKTAVLDYLIDEEHPDLVTEIIPSNYPYPEPPNIDTIPTFPINPPRSYYNHGTAVASFVSAETAKQGEVSHGQLASVGFDTKIIPYKLVLGSIETTRNDFLQKALHSSTVAGVDVLVACAGGAILCEPNPASGENLVMKEILNNGTVIVMPAGNGQSSPYYCGDDYHAMEHYPFNSSYDERVIVVTSTDSLDYHRYIDSGIDKTHSHFPAVDICAPGYHLMGAEHTHFAYNPNWPYYGNNSGTSFAAPIVAGACALLKSINRDFTPGEIQYFIKSTADPVMDESDFPGMLGTGRLNVYRAVQMANNCSPGIISSNKSWNNDTTVVCGVEIMQGSCLTIGSTVKLSKHSPIIIHQGGKLVIDGGCLTSLDEIMWPGIEVWGSSSANQYPVNGCYAQGYLELKNGAVIENAVCAVELWHPDYANSTGGIVRADSSVFRNNAMAVHALNYTNYDPISGAETSYAAFFQNCAFVIDDGFLGTETFRRHIDLDHVNGVSFKGCSFFIDPGVQNVSPLSRGIDAYDAGFNVTAWCSHAGTGNQFDECPKEYLVHSSFTGFNDAVHSVSDGNVARSFRVTGCVFTCNDRGVFAQNTGYATILDNEFRIGSDAECAYGVYAKSVTGFYIEGNVFSAIGAKSTNFGVGIFDCESNNDVYLNTFNGLDCGNVAVGNNLAVIPDPPIDRIMAGLTYSCNQNTRNTVDFFVTSGENNGGIKPNQGSAASPAGNTFSGSSYHFYNDGAVYVDYYYNTYDADQIPDPSKIHRVNRISTSNSNSCQSHYGPVIKSPQEKSELTDDFLLSREAYSNLLKIYMSRIDGGNTLSEVADLLSATPSDAQRLRTRLLGLSPYLSQEVLTTAADRNDVFSDLVLFEIFSSNPDELKKDTLINYLEQKVPPLPGYMVAMLRQIASGTTPRTILTAQMAQYEHEAHLAAGDIVRSNLNDSITNPQELRAWLGNMDNIASDRMAIASYMQEGDYKNAFGLAALLPDLYELDGDGLREHLDYMRLLGLFDELHASGRTTAQMTNNERSMVDSIANGGIGFSKSMAEAICEEVSGEPGIVGYDCPILPSVGRMRGSTGISESDNNNISVTVTPNPAQTKACVSYVLPEMMSEAVLEMTSALGVKVGFFPLEGQQGIKEIDLGKLPPGVYTYTVRCGNNTVIGKLVTVH